MKSRKSFLLWGLLAFVLVAADMWSYFAMTHAKDQANLAAHNADLCQRMSEQIITLQAKPVVADTQEKAFERLTRRIEAAARQEGIGEDNHLASIGPEPAGRVADTVYLEKPTTIQIREATLSQVVGLICRLALDGSGLRIKALRLSAPPRKENTDLWSAELTVTYLIYAPLPAQQFNSERS
jgi:hypothetical protein